VKISLSPRYVKECDGGLRPFQKKLLEETIDGKSRIVLLDAPVGSGKTHVVRLLLEQREFERRPIIFTYPTKILMEAQVSSLYKEVGKDKVKVWPFEDMRKNSINLFLYSTDSLLHAIRRERIIHISNRSELLNKLFSDLGWYSKQGGVITSPDVLYLLKEGKYKKSKEILNNIQNSLFIFDEFHCYHGLSTFPTLLEFLLSTIAEKIVLLSATPVESEALKEIEQRYGINKINFLNSLGNHQDTCFNYPVKVDIQSFKYSNLDETERQLFDLLPHLPRPCAIIFDSIFRLRHIERRLRFNKLKGLKIKEWSGMIKDSSLASDLDDETIVLGTSAIEVGIDMKFKSIIFEATYWPSAIQRLGRVGRKEQGEAIMFTRKDFSPFLDDKCDWDRTDFEQKILKEALNNPREEVGDGFGFRGESFNFILIDEELQQHFFYNENLFAMYDIDDYYIDDWRCLDTNQKKKVLYEFKIPERNIEEIILRDRIIPFWGLLKGKIRREYRYIDYADIVPPKKERNELSILGYIFYGK